MKPSPTQSSRPISEQLTLADNNLAQVLFGEQGQNLRLIGRLLGVKLASRGHQVTAEGPEPQVKLALRAIEELYRLLETGYALAPQDVQHAVRILQGQGDAAIKDIFLDTVYISAMKQHGPSRHVPVTLFDLVYPSLLFMTLIIWHVYLLVRFIVAAMICRRSRVQGSWG